MPHAGKVFSSPKGIRSVSNSYLQEILEQPQALQRVPSAFTPHLQRDIGRLKAAIDGGKIRHVVITGMGGSLHSAYGSWLRLSALLPVPVTLWDTAELIQQAPSSVSSSTLLLAISQSGESAELKRLTEIAKTPFCFISITNTLENSLARHAHLCVATNAGPENTVSTKTYTSGLAALYLVESLLTSKWNGAVDTVQTIAELLAPLIDQVRQSVDSILGFIEHEHTLSFIGRGASYSSAAMGALATVEATKLNAAAYTGGQFRHGPFELIRDGFRSILFLGTGGTRSLNEKMCVDIARLGGRCLLIGSRPIGAIQSHNVRTVELPDASPALLPILEIVPIQLLMIPLARARGFEPAAFLNSSKVTSVE